MIDNDTVLQKMVEGEMWKVESKGRLVVVGFLWQHDVVTPIAPFRFPLTSALPFPNFSSSNHPFNGPCSARVFSNTIIRNGSSS